MSSDIQKFIISLYATSVFLVLTNKDTQVHIISPLLRIIKKQVDINIDEYILSAVIFLLIIFGMMYIKLPFLKKVENNKM